ncbi:hypothetical protein OJAV_G00203580 [Oryzias javanicus]|uniref:Uncharacterized protein n=1 Tax=Oryzias javanicus TaxID=123683 RepID=A0A437C593_ORYJA|nr:hypothetical protein OJAV_G00203580 [Oryzias javanicus]
MGNCTSRAKKKRKEASTRSHKSYDGKPSEDVTYASINHENTQGQRRFIANTDCDYATVGLPQNLVPETVSNCSSKEECTDDYVLME